MVGRCRAVAGAIVAVVCALAGPTAHAQTDDEQARAHFEAGRAYYDEGDFERALQEFGVAFDISRRPLLRLNLATTHERLGHWAEAAEQLRQYLAEAGDTVENRTLLERRIANDERRAAAARTEQVPSEPTPTTTRRSGDLVPAIIGYSVGGAGFAALGIFGGLALAEQSSVRDGCFASRSCTDADLSTMDAFGYAADIGLGVGIAGAITGTVLLLVFGLDQGQTETAWLPSVNAEIARR